MKFLFLEKFLNYSELTQRVINDHTKQFSQICLFYQNLSIKPVNASLIFPFHINKALTLCRAQPLLL